MGIGMLWYVYDTPPQTFGMIVRLHSRPALPKGSGCSGTQFSDVTRRCGVLLSLPSKK